MTNIYDLIKYAQIFKNGFFFICFKSLKKWGNIKLKYVLWKINYKIVSVILIRGLHQNINYLKFQIFLLSSAPLNFENHKEQLKTVISLILLKCINYANEIMKYAKYNTWYFLYQYLILIMNFYTEFKIIILNFKNHKE